MNLVVDDAVEVKLATKDEAESRRELGMFMLLFRIEGKLLMQYGIGQILLKGDNVSLIQSLQG
jgi:small nuclear ribonucleoprotein E